MKTAELKLELQRLIEQEQDADVLEAIRTILQKTGIHSILKEKLSIRALKSEKDIKDGSILSRDEVARRVAGK